MNTVEKVKALCKERKVPISKLEKELNFSNGYIGQLRKGTFPHDRLFKIASYFNVPIEELLDEKEKSPVVSNEASEIDIQILNALKGLSEEQKAQALDFALFLANNSKK